MKLFLLSKGEAGAMKAEERAYPGGWWLRTKSGHPGGHFFAIRPTGSGYISEFASGSHMALRPAVNVRKEMMGRLKRKSDGSYLLGTSFGKKLEWIPAGTKSRLLMKEHLWMGSYGSSLEYETSGICLDCFLSDKAMFTKEEREMLMDAPEGRIEAEDGSIFSLRRLRAFFKDVGLKGEPSDVLKNMSKMELSEIWAFAGINNID